MNAFRGRFCLSTMSSAVAASLTLAVQFYFLAPVVAQSPVGFSNDSSPVRAEDLTSSSSPLLGGGGGADFTELMMLIQQTIDPDAWLDASSVLTPFPSGVFIDPAGQLKQTEFAAAASAKSFALPSGSVRQPWRTDSPLRVVSLRQLDRAVARATAAGLLPALEHNLLAGLSRIEFVQVDIAGRDVLLAGPADGVHNAQLQGFQLADLGLLIGLIGAGAAPLGCSIDPTDAGIVAAQQLLQPAGAAKRLAIDPEKFAGQMQAKIGPHRVRVFGMPGSSPAAHALVAADEHMKQIGFGTADTPVPIENYFEHLDRQTDVPSQSLIRWWFTYSQQTIHCNSLCDTFQLPEQSVVLLSEQQWVSQQGRKATGQHDAAADAFAASMTAALAELRLAHPAYARLCALFESALALQLGLAASEQDSFQDWFPELSAIGRNAAQGGQVPQTVSGLTAWHRLQQGTVVAVVSGGVQMDARAAAGRPRWRTRKLGVNLSESAGDQQPNDPWWWD